MEIEIMKSFHACSENRGLNKDDEIFFSNISKNRFLSLQMDS